MDAITEVPKPLDRGDVAPDFVLPAADRDGLGVVIGSPARTRQYFRHFPACFPMAAAPDRALHRAYGLPAWVRTPEFRAETELKAAEALRELGREAPEGQAAGTFMAFDGLELTADDTAEQQRPLQAIGYFLIGGDGVIRWTRFDLRFQPLPTAQEILPVV